MKNHYPQSDSSNQPSGEFLTHNQLQNIKTICRALRKQPTSSEDYLWQALRNRKLAGLKFLRQHPFGPSIVDFYCHEKRLVVEVDGGIHKQRDMKEKDRRTRRHPEALEG